MNDTIMPILQRYYKAMSEKNITELGQYLHPNVYFISPFAKIEGKERYLEWTKQFMDFFKTYTVRAEMSSGNQAMLVYDVAFNAPLEDCRAAALITFQGGLITAIELFFDGRSFDKK